MALSRQPSPMGLEADETAPLPGMEPLVAAERAAYAPASDHICDHENEAANCEFVRREPCQKIVYFLHNIPPEHDFT